MKNELREQIEEATGIIAEMAENKRANGYIGDETELFCFTDELGSYLKLITKVQKCKSAKQIRKVLMGNYDFSQGHTNRDISFLD